MTEPSLIDALRPVNWHTFALASARAGGLVMVAPLWSMPAIPATLRGALAILLALAVLPALPAAAEPTTLSAGFVLAGEVLVGLALGLTAAVFLHGMAVAAEVIGLQMGLSLGAAFDPASGMGSPGIGSLTFLLAMAVYTAAGGHLLLAAGFARSFAVLPPGAVPNLDGGGRAVLALAGTVFDVGVRAAAPAMAALLVANLALALLNRAVPQLNTMMVAIPVTVGLGLLVLGAALPTLAAWIAGWVGGLGDAADTMATTLAPAAAPAP